MPHDTLTTYLTNCTVQLFVGVYDHEKPVTQPVVVDVEVTSAAPRRFDDLAAANLAHVIDYDPLYHFVTALLPGLGHIALLESLAERIIAFCFEDPRISETRVRLEKPDAFGGKALAGIEMRRTRS